MTGRSHGTIVLLVLVALLLHLVERARPLAFRRYHPCCSPGGT